MAHPWEAIVAALDADPEAALMAQAEGPEEGEQAPRWLTGQGALVHRSDQCLLQFPGPWQVICGGMANQLHTCVGRRTPSDLLPLGWILWAHGATPAFRFLPGRDETSGVSSHHSEPPGGVGHLASFVQSSTLLSKITSNYLLGGFLSR
jgi:hypothetical protein